MNIVLGSEAKLHPVMAVLLYKRVAGDGGSSLLVVEHGAEVENGKVRLGAGRAASEQAITEIVSNLSGALNVAPRVIHSRVLVDVPGLFAWWMPAGKRIFYFDVDNFNREDVSEARKALRNRKATLPHPALVFVQRGVGQPSTYVFALCESERPQGATEVCMAPMLNVNNGGWICWGSTRLPAAPVQESFTAYEEAFFGSTFSHLNQQNMVEAGGRSMYQFVADMCDAPPETFPVEVLKPVGTLDAVIQQFSKGRLA